MKKTNGDMIKALLPKERKYTLPFKDIITINLDKNWWNAEYKEETMNKADIYKTAYDILSEIYTCEDAHSQEYTLGEIMGVMSMALEIENIVISETPKASDHDGCVHCKWLLQDETEQPCKSCRNNYTDKWEKINE